MLLNVITEERPAFLPWRCGREREGEGKERRVREGEGRERGKEERYYIMPHYRYCYSYRGNRGQSSSVRTMLPRVNPVYNDPIRSFHL